MVGGHVIENSAFVLPEGVGECRRLWCVNGYDECIVYADVSASVIECGEEIWWQGKAIYARKDKLALRKIGYSHSPQAEDIRG